MKESTLLKKSMENIFYANTLLKKRMGLFFLGGGHRIITAPFERLSHMQNGQNGQNNPYLLTFQVHFETS